MKNKPSQDRKAILRILDFLESEGLLTNTEINQIVLNRFKSSDNPNEVIKFILTSGKPEGIFHCSRCKENLKANEFSYYQARVNKHGYLARSNALCSKCSKETGKKRSQVLKENEALIPPKPEPGSRCPNCNRAWSGEWHRHHEGDQFKEWLCSNCNMALQDQRNPKTKYGRK